MKITILGENMNSFFEWARQNKWQIKLSDKKREVPERAFHRYARLPADYIKFLEQVRLLANEADTSWFLTMDDFNAAAPDTPWQPDSFEQISLEAAAGDSGLTNAVKEFWDTHIPIVFCLASGYEHYAIRLRDGAVVNGIEPEFEETSVPASSFEEFLSKITQGAIIL